MATLQMDQRNYIVHPLRFALWLFILTIIMIFGSLTSAYIVQKGMLIEPLIFDLPSILWNNLIIILFSSVTMQYAVYAARREENQRAVIALLMTFVLGCFFLWGQWQAWIDLTESGLPFVDNTRLDEGSGGRSDNSVSFFYIFTGLHGLHIVAALIVLVFAVVNTGLSRYKKEKKRLTYSLTATFWHFLGLLWLYLFVFLKYTEN
ncbi:MAG: cytochrome c oxidase subunit 3 [Bacteroidota bacterium]